MNPPLRLKKGNVMSNRIDLTNSTPSSNFCDGEGEGLLLSNGVRPNPFPKHKLVNGGVEENIFEFPNPGSGDFIPGNLGIMEKSDVVEEVHRDAGLAALGENVHSKFGMDEGNADEDDESIIVAKK